MDFIRIQGGNPLKGSVHISGAKNAALPLLSAALLTDQPFVLKNVPDLADIRSMCELLTQHGCHIIQDKNTISIQANNIVNIIAPYDLVRKMRASILVLGPLVARFGKARVSLPGGCAIGTRPVDLHLRGLEQLGAVIDIQEGYITAKAPKGLVGATISMPVISVTATENLMMAATLAKGTTRIINAAREPEVMDLAKCLQAMGAHIEGAGTDRITIQGPSTFKAVEHTVVPDRIEAGTYMIAALMTNGSLTLEQMDVSLIPTVSAILENSGAHLSVTHQENSQKITVERKCERLQGVDVMTEPYPGFATDLQAQMMALMTLCEGASMITETIFENRFMHVPELCRMGANITVHGSSALVRGVEKLSGAPVMATDLRASVSLVIAGLAAKGETIVNRIYHLDRGYDHIVEKIQALGGDIERVKRTGTI